MDIVANVLIGIVAARHLCFLVLEMFLWTTPTGRATLGLEAGFVEQIQAALLALGAVLLAG
jgi:putative membrane protein